MLQLEIFIRELVSINGFAAISLQNVLSILIPLWLKLNWTHIVVCKITSLEHETRDHTMEGRAFITKAMFTSAQLAEILCSLWDNIIIQLEYDATKRT